MKYYDNAIIGNYKIYLMNLLSIFSFRIKCLSLLPLIYILINDSTYFKIIIFLQIVFRIYLFNINNHESAIRIYPYMILFNVACINHKEKLGLTNTTELYTLLIDSSLIFLIMKCVYDIIFWYHVCIYFMNCYCCIKNTYFRHHILIKFDDIMNINQDDTKCCICYDNFVNGDILLKTSCNHYDHYDCMKPWLTVSQRCPRCRAII